MPLPSFGSQAKAQHVIDAAITYAIVAIVFHEIGRATTEPGVHSPFWAALAAALWPMDDLCHRHCRAIPLQSVAEAWRSALTASEAHRSPLRPAMTAEAAKRQRRGRPR